MLHKLISSVQWKIHNKPSNMYKSKVSLHSSLQPLVQSVFKIDLVQTVVVVFKVLVSLCYDFVGRSATSCDSRTIQVLCEQQKSDLLSSEKDADIEKCILEYKEC